MRVERLTLVVVTAAVVLSAGCAAGGSTTGQNAAAAQSAPPPTAAAKTASSVGNACDRLVDVKDDVATILGQAVTSTEEHSAGTIQTCEFKVTGFESLTITLRPGQGNVVMGIWQSGKMPTSSEPLSGVGERAVWVAALTEVIATKNDLLCDVGVPGLPSANGSKDVARKRLGDLCNKIFARPQ